MTGLQRYLSRRHADGLPPELAANPMARTRLREAEDRRADFYLVRNRSARFGESYGDLIAA